MSPETSSAATRTSAARCTITNSVNSRSRSAGHLTGTHLSSSALALNTHVDTPHTGINSVHVACRTRKIDDQGHPPHPVGTRRIQSPGPGAVADGDRPAERDADVDSPPGSCHA